jgi:outer membrane lipoprotein-sorting protein
MHLFRIFLLAAILLPSLPSFSAQAQQAANPPLPEIHQLMKEVHEHQKQLDKVRENYTYSVSLAVQEIDSKGQVSKTETHEAEVFFVNGHEISRVVKKEGKPLAGSDLDKETERVTKLVEKAEKTPPDQPLEGHAINISISHLLDIMDVLHERRENYRGRPAIVFDFVGRKDAQTHGLAEDASKKLQGTIWVDEADRQVAHCDVKFDENFHVAGGVVATIQKGSNFHFDQAQVNGEIWLPTGAEGSLQARVLLVKGYRQHLTERDYDYKRFHVEAQPGKDAKAVVENKP